jgi:hypothetical protein
MSPSGFDNLFSKVKSVTKQAADTTARQAKLAKLKMNLLTLQTEKSRHYQTIGIRTHDMYGRLQRIDGQVLLDQVQEDLAQLARIDQRVLELEEEVAAVQASANQVEVADVTERDHT